MSCMIHRSCTSHYKRQYIEWQDRGTSTGAPVAIHDADSDILVKPQEVKTTKIDYQMVTILITLQIILYCYW